MATEGAPATAALSGKLPFYSTPEPLSAERHGNMGVKRVDHPLAFAASTNVVPLAAGEFGLAAQTFPIIFAGPDKTPLAVMGLREKENLFIPADGKIDPELYVPAFIRRYPFVFAEDKTNERFVVCVDVGSDLVTADKPDVAFFEDGKPTEFTNNAIEFLRGFESERLATKQLVDLLVQHDLFEERDVKFQNRDAAGADVGEPVMVAQYQAVSMTKLNALSPDVFISLRDSGALGAIYAHALSLTNWQRVLNRAVKNAPPVAAA